MLGIAHNDLHQGNMIYDPETRDTTIIDFGQAAEDDEEDLSRAINEIVGFVNGRGVHTQLTDLVPMDSPVYEKMYQNVRKAQNF